MSIISTVHCRPLNYFILKNVAHRRYIGKPLHQNFKHLGPSDTDNTEDAMAIRWGYDRQGSIWVS